MNDAMTIYQPINHFLTQLGISLDDRHHNSVDNSPLEPDDNSIALLTYYGLLAISGPDTETFLQGQTTCDVAEVNDHSSRPGAYCTPKGRMVTSFQLARLDSEHFLLRMRRPLVDSSQAVLAKYIVFSKAEQHNASDDYIAVGLRGDNAAAAVNSAFGATPEGLYGTVSSDGNIAIQLDDTGKTFECWIQTDRIEALWPALSRGLKLQGSRSWELLTMRRGHGEVTADTAEIFTPQMLNYQLTGAVSFTKGCYTGQEVVARLHYKGKLKRHMYRIVAATPMAPGDPLYSDTGTQTIGEIVNAVGVADRQTEALAVITRKDVEQNSVFADVKGTKVEVLSLPYAITNETT